MNSVIIVVAQYLLFALAAVVAVAVLVASPRVRWTSAAAGVLGLALLGVLIVVAAALHTDPRPFVADPSVHPLFPHAADNGFPSDHSAAAGLLGVIAWRVRRPIGVVTAVGAVLIAGARVVAHVHHLQDVAAGLLLGGLAGAGALAAVDHLAARTQGRGRTPTPG